MDTNVNCEIDAADGTDYSKSEPVQQTDDHEKQESQCQTFSQNDMDDAISSSSSHGDNDSELMMAPEVSSGKRRRKQQKPQRCTRLIQPLPPVFQFEPTTEPTPVPQVECDTNGFEHLSSDDQQFGNPAMEVPQIKLQPTSLNRYLQRKPIKTGFHMKTLHRPYFKKGVKGVFRSQPHQCADCGLKFPLRDTLLKHITLKHTVKVHQCSFCGKQYRLADSLRKHIKRDHSGETHHCVVCDKYFTSKESLKQHWRIHSGEKPYRCQVCNARFRYRNNYKQHVQMHSGIMTSCEFCGKQYNRRDSLKKHIREIHRQEDDCTTGGPQRLVASEELLTSGASHITPVATNALESNQSNESLINNLNKLVHFCRKCSLSFTSRQNLLRHMQTRHHKVILVCPICNLEYHLRDSLRKHVKNVHHMKLKDERNTRAEMEVRRLFKNPNSRVLVADIEPDNSHFGKIFQNPNSDEKEAAYSGNQNVTKCPFCDRCYGHRDSLTRHVKLVHHLKLKDARNRPTRAQLEIIRLFKSHNSQMLKAGGETGVRQSVKETHKPSSTQGKVSQVAPYAHVKKLKKCPFCDRYYRLRDSLRRHIKMQHKKSIKDLKETETKDFNPAGKLSDKILGGETNFGQEGQRKCEQEAYSNEDRNVFDEGIQASSQILWKSLSLPVKEKCKDQTQNGSENNSQEMGDFYKISPLNDPGSAVKPDTPSHALNCFFCATCGVNFETEEELSIHAVNHPTCPICKRQYTLRDSLRHHIKRSHPVYHQDMMDRKNKQKAVQFPFNDQGVTGNDQSQRIHQRNAEAETDSNRCSTCNLCFKSQSELDIHGKMHLQCQYCPKQYDLKDSLRKHIQNTHPAEYWERRNARNNQKFAFFGHAPSAEVSPKSVKEKVADSDSNTLPHFSMIKTSPHSNDLPDHQEHLEHHYGSSCEAHEEDDSQEFNKSAISCNHEFEDDELRAKHLIKCTACPYCSKLYCLRDSLRKHIRRTHADEHEANGLATRVLLQNSTVGKLPYCSVCNQTFEIPIDLEEHKKSHPRCQYCGQVYALKESLRTHIYRKHADIHRGGKGKSADSDARFVWNETNSKSMDGSESYSQSSHISGELERSLDPDQSKLDFTKEAMDKYGYQDYKHDFEATNSGQSSNAEKSQVNADQNDCASILPNKPVDVQSNDDPQFRNIFPCSACMVVFENQEALDMHIKCHLACHVCGKLYTLRDSLRKHIKRSHPDVHDAMLDEKQQKRTAAAQLNEAEVGDPGYENVPLNDSDMAMKNLCYVCFIQFDSEELYESHTKTHPACTHCGKMYRLKDSLKKHVQRSHPAEYEAEREGRLKAKMDAERLHIETQFSATEQQALSLADFEQLPDGLNIPTNSQEPEEQFFPCSACMHVFETQELLDEHVKIHPKCPHCGRRYKLVDSLRKHIKRTHPIEEEERRKTLYKEDLVSPEEQVGDLHVQILNVEPTELETSTMSEENTAEEETQAFPCNACPIIFESQELLDEHIETHPACPHCGKRYKLFESLRRHVNRTHPIEEEERKRKLAKETEKINLTSSNSNHSSISTGDCNGSATNDETIDVVFPCPACAMIFNTKEALQAHASSHLACPYCGRLYTLRNSMRKHIQRSHPDEYEREKLNSYSFGFRGGFADNPSADHPTAVADCDEQTKGSSEMEVLEQKDSSPIAYAADDHTDNSITESELLDATGPRVKQELDDNSFMTNDYGTESELLVDATGPRVKQELDDNSFMTNDYGSTKESVKESV